MSEKKWSGRAFTSLCSLVGFILLCFTGIILYIEPHGRVAYWIKWQFWGLEKDQWGAVHIFSGLLFLIAGGFHLYYNWKPLIKYLSGKIESALRYKRELLVSSFIFFWVVISGIWSLPPLVYVSDLGEAIKRSWVTSPELEPPFGHAELVSLQTFCKKQRIPLDQAMMELRKAGFEVETPKSTLTEIAESKHSSGMGVYAAIKKLETKPTAMKPDAVWTAGKVEEVFSGTGLGNKTIGQIIKDMHLDPKKVYQRLKAANIETKDDDTMKQVAKEHNTTPIKIMTVILIKQ
ncbi:MAG: DUF4405 domain-containing protein [Desulfobacterales bacterium]|nr:DUF4405 domain-containing protein [Desulfobacterales bacterium]MDX2511782.1 DUF4405 domain-containing protein [Desulfobacterales bacterium]